MGLVYSTDGGRVRRCARCGQPEHNGACRQQAARAEPSDGVLRVRRETSGRRGKTVTTVSGLRGTAARQTVSELKRLCGSGGTLAAGDVIELQGDHRERVIAHLRASGHTVKAAGG